MNSNIDFRFSISSLFYKPRGLKENFYFCQEKLEFADGMLFILIYHVNINFVVNTLFKNHNQII